MELVSLRFVDINGNAKELLIPEEKFREGRRDGFGFDGSSVQGFVRRFESDMLLIPEYHYTVDNLKIYFCDVYGHDGKPCGADPRVVLKNSMEAVREEGVSFLAGVELEFYLFSGRQPMDGAGYFDVSPRDKAYRMKLKVVEALEKVGIEWESTHHEVGPGQNEVDLKYDVATKTADKVLLAKDFIKQIAEEESLSATFMPKPIEGRPGNGMHVHLSLAEEGRNLFYDREDEYQLSEDGKRFLAGILEHAKALTAVAAPTVNSYKRLGEFEAPRYVYWGRRNRDALVRVPHFFSPSSARVEFRLSDPSANPYFLLSGLLASGLDGIEKGLELENPIERDIYEDGTYKTLEEVPSNLKEALEELKRDRVVRKSLGGAYEKFVELKEEEWKLYERRVVTDWEWKRYWEA